MSRPPAAGAQPGRPDFLSDAFFARLSGALARAPLPPDAPVLVVGVLVTEVPPDGADSGYRLHIGGGEPARVEAGPPTGADVVLVERFEDAEAMAAGAVSAAALLEGGRIKLRGDVTRLVEATELLASLGRALAEGSGDTEVGI